MLCHCLVHETPVLNRLNKTVAENTLRLSLLCVHGECWGALGAAPICSLYLLSLLRCGSVCRYTQPAWSTLPENLADAANIALIFKRHNLYSRSGRYIRNTHHHPHWGFFSIYIVFLCLTKKEKGSEITCLNRPLSGYLHFLCCSPTQVKWHSLVSRSWWILLVAAGCPPVPGKVAVGDYDCCFSGKLAEKIMTDCTDCTHSLTFTWVSCSVHRLYK